MNERESAPVNKTDCVETSLRYNHYLLGNRGVHALCGNNRSKVIKAAKRNVWKRKEITSSCTVENKVEEESYQASDDKRNEILISAYYVDDHKLCRDLRQKYPFLRFVHRVTDADKVFYPTDIYYVIAYHYACMTLRMDADASSFVFTNNHFDDNQFEDYKETLYLTPNFDLPFFANFKDGKFRCGGVAFDQTDDVSIVMDLNQICPHYCVYIHRFMDDEFDDTSLHVTKSKENVAEDKYQNIIAEVRVFASVRVKTETLRQNLQSRFLWLCKAHEIEPRLIRERFENDLNDIMTEYQYESIPFAVVEWLATKLPKGVMSEILIGTLRLKNRDGSLDAAFWNIAKKYISPDFTIEIGSFVDSVRGFLSNAGGAMVAKDICGELLCDKKRTYKIDIKDIRFERIGICTDRDAYYKIGPGIPGFIPQVSSTCSHSTMNALETRFVSELSKDMPENIEAYDTAHSMLKKTLYRLMGSKGFDFKYMSYFDFIDSTTWPSGAKRVARNLVPEIEGNELSWLDVKTRAFAKHEELKNKTSINTRLIQGFHIGMTMITGRIIKSIYKSLKPVLSDPHEEICVGSMMYAEEIGEWFNFHSANTLHSLDLDGDAYDSTTRKYRVDAIYKLYFELAGFEAEGIHILSNSLKINGELFTHGIKYRLSEDHFKAGHAPMASGRCDTTLTNTLMRLEEGLYYMSKAGVLGACIASGDDLSLLYSGDIITEEKIAEVGLLLKRKEKFENNNRLYSVFLQKRFYPVGNNIVPAPKVGRVLSKLFWMDSKISASKRHRVLKGDLLGILATANHVPILSDVARRFISLIDKEAIVNSNFNRKEWMESKQTHVCDEYTLAFFSEVYDITIDDIKSLQYQISKMDFDSEFDGPIFQKIFEVDLPNAEPKREGLVPRFNPTWSINKTLSLLPWWEWGMTNQHFKMLVLAPTFEEIFKLGICLMLSAFLPFLTGVFTLFGPALIALFEAFVPNYGIHKIDFYARFFLHWTLSFGPWLVARSLKYEYHMFHSILFHSAYNLCVLTGCMYPFIITNATAKLKLYAVVLATLRGKSLSSRLQVGVIGILDPTFPAMVNDVYRIMREYFSVEIAVWQNAYPFPGLPLIGHNSFANIFYSILLGDYFWDNSVLIFVMSFLMT